MKVLAQQGSDRFLVGDEELAQVVDRGKMTATRRQPTQQFLARGYWEVPKSAWTLTEATAGIDLPEEEFHPEQDPKR